MGTMDLRPAGAAAGRDAQRRRAALHPRRTAPLHGAAPRRAARRAAAPRRSRLEALQLRGVGRGQGGRAAVCGVHQEAGTAEKELYAATSRRVLTMTSERQDNEQGVHGLRSLLLSMPQYNNTDS